MAQLAVVDAHVGVDQPARAGFVGQRVVQVVEHHVGVVYGVLSVLGETVAVVPLAHQGQRLVNVLIECAALPIHLQQAAHLRLREAQQLVELRQLADVDADVEAAGDIVHRHRRDAGDEQPVDAAGLRAGLQRGEEAPIEAAAVGEGVVGVCAALGEDRVGEIVVFVDQHINGSALPLAVAEQRHQFVVDGAFGAQPRGDGRREDLRMALQDVGEHDAAVALEVALQRSQGVVEGGEVEPQHQVAAAVRRGGAADVRAAKHGVERAGLVAAVVALQQREPAGLAEPARADEEDVAVALEAVQEPRLVDVQCAFLADALEVRLAVGNGRVGLRPRRSDAHAAILPRLAGRSLGWCVPPAPPQAARTAVKGSSPGPISWVLSMPRNGRSHASRA